MTREEKQPDVKRQKMDNDDDSSQTVSPENDLSSPKDKPQGLPVPLLEYTLFVKITVGPEEKTFYAYKEPLCTKSDFFKTACQGPFQDFSETVHLPQQDATIVNYFIHWISTGQFRGLYNKPSPTLSKLKQAVENATKSYYTERAEKLAEANTALDLANYRDLPLQQLVDLYIFTESTQVRGLKDAIIDTVIEAYGNPEAPRTAKAICFWDLKEDRLDWLADPIRLINTAWEHLPTDSPLRLVILNLFCDAVTTISGTRYATELCPEFLAASFDRINRNAKAAGKGIVYEPWLKVPICKYHCHDVPCSKQ